MSVRNQNKKEIILEDAMRSIVPLFMIIEIFVHILSLTIPVVLLNIYLNERSLYILFSFFLSLIYIYPLLIGFLTAFIYRIMPKPPTGKIVLKKDFIKYSMLIFLDTLVMRTSARWMVWMNPFPAFFYNKICGANIHASVGISSPGTINDPYLITIGKGTLIGNGGYICGHYRPNLKYFLLGRVIIGENVLVGKNSTIWPNVTIENNAIIQERSSLLPGTHVKCNQIWGGNPAKEIKREKVFESYNNNELSIKKIVSEFITGYDLMEIDNLDPNQSLYELGLIDSLSMQKLISYIETKFNIIVSEKDQILDYTLNDIFSLVKS